MRTGNVNPSMCGKLPSKDQSRQYRRNQEVSPAFRTSRVHVPGLLFPNDPVSRILHGADESLQAHRGRVILHSRFLGREVHVGRADTIRSQERLLDPSAHAAHVIPVIGSETLFHSSLMRS